MPRDSRAAHSGSLPTASVSDKTTGKYVAVPSHNVYTASNMKKGHTEQTRQLLSVQLYPSNTKEHMPSAGSLCTAQDTVTAGRLSEGHMLRQQRKEKSEATQMRSGLPAVRGTTSNPVPHQLSGTQLTRPWAALLYSRPFPIRTGRFSTGKKVERKPNEYLTKTNSQS